MNKYVLAGCGILMAGVLVGCGSRDDALFRDQIALQDEMSAILEKVADAASLKEAEAKLAKMKGRHEANLKRLDALPKDKQEALKKHHESAMRASLERLLKAEKFAALRAKSGAGGLKFLGFAE